MRALRSLYDRPYLLLTLTSLFWAGNAIVGRAVAETWPPVLLAQLRWTLAALLVLPFAWPHLRRDAALIGKHWLVLTVLAFTGITVFNTVVYAALKYTTAVNVVLIQATMPLLIGVTAFFIHGDRLTGRQIAGILASLLGVLVIVTGGDPNVLLHLSVNIGDAMVLAALALYTVYMALLKTRPKMHWLSFLAVTMAWGAVLLLPATAWELASGARPEISGGNALALAYVVIFPSILAYICFNRGVELVGPNRAGPFFHLVPLFGVILSVTLLGERFTWIHALAAALIAAGVLAASLRGRPAIAPRPPAAPPTAPQG